AVDSFKAASDANDALQADLNAKDYGKAKTDAKTLLDAANKAKTDVDAGKAAMKTAVDGIVAAINLDVPAVQKEIALATKAGKKSKVDVKPLKTLIADTQKAIADVKAAEDAGNIADADSKATAAQTTLENAKKQLEDAGYKA
ncbi:MAG TPA: hypothetical protein VMC79_12625, partial [Rectinemataceae bacterium]|nr:hypothetical protein [Rectinemataceae bacterium]